jgi:hypothetical protein
MERNADAFKQTRVIKKGSKSQHAALSGCHCKKSNCLKKYCECFTAIIPCTSKCQCLECQNVGAKYSHLQTLPHHTSQRVEADAEEPSMLSQISMSSDLITASQMSNTFSREPMNLSPADTLLQLAGVRREMYEHNGRCSISSPRYAEQRHNRFETLSFSSFSLSINGLNSPIIHRQPPRPISSSTCSSYSLSGGECNNNNAADVDQSPMAAKSGSSTSGTSSQSSETNLASTSQEVQSVQLSKWRV